MTSDKWLTNLSAEELKAAMQTKPPFKPYTVDGLPVFLNYGQELLPDEVFRKHPDLPVETSNYGRIRREGEVLVQRPGGQEEKKSDDAYGYLWVDIPEADKHERLVYRLVAKTWCERPEEKYNTVHHINNNGMDNRPNNLLWVTPEQHWEVHRRV